MTEGLDRELHRWACAPEAVEARADPIVAAALAELPAHARPAPRWRWGAGAALAAGLAAAAALLPMRDAPRSPPAVSVAAAVEPAPEVFASLFVPTPEEEDYL